MKALILYFTVISLVALVLILILSAYLKLSFSKKLVLYMAIIFSEVFILPNLSSYFQFNVIYGGDHLPSRSSTRSEAIKRGVFVCDLKLISLPSDLSDSMYIKVKEAWIEKDWTGGYWFWTTLPGSGYRYNVTVLTKEIRGNWIINRGLNEEYLYYDDREKGFSGNIRGLPKSDTLVYHVLKENKMDFEDSDIIGEIKFILGERKF